MDDVAKPNVFWHCRGPASARVLCSTSPVFQVSSHSVSHYPVTSQPVASPRFCTSPSGCPPYHSSRSGHSVHNTSIPEMDSLHHYRGGDRYSTPSPSLSQQVKLSAEKWALVSLSSGACSVLPVSQMSVEGQLQGERPLCKFNCIWLSLTAWCPVLFSPAVPAAHFIAALECCISLPFRVGPHLWPQVPVRISLTPRSSHAMHRVTVLPPLTHMMVAPPSLTANRILLRGCVFHPTPASCPTIPQSALSKKVGDEMISPYSNKALSWLGCEGFDAVVDRRTESILCIDFIVNF